MQTTTTLRSLNFRPWRKSHFLGRNLGYFEKRLRYFPGMGISAFMYAYEIFTLALVVQRIEEMIT